MMKRALSLALALALCLGISLPACAADQTEQSAAVVSAAGSTTITGSDGRVHTLSQPVLYTFTRPQIEKLMAFTGAGVYYSAENYADVDVIYAISPGTLVTAPDGMGYYRVATVNTLWSEDGSLTHLVANPVDGPLGDTSLQLPEEPDMMVGFNGRKVSSFIVLWCCADSELDSRPLSEVTCTDKVAFCLVSEETRTNPFGDDMTTTDPDTPTQTTFSDVAAGAYYADAVAWAVENGVTNGTSSSAFSPDVDCTRAQVVTFLWRAAGAPAPASADNPFSDVLPGAYYYDAVLWAVENGVTNGTSATAFSPDATVTRSQTVTFMYRAAKAEAETGSSPFVDVAAGEFYANAVQWAVNNDITTGTSATTFSPGLTCTRAQIVTFLYRAYGA